MSKISRAKFVHRCKKIVFTYPKDLRWSCIKCAACCRDPQNRERMILLLRSDIRRLEDAGFMNFYEEIDENQPFIALMNKIGERCTFLKENSCLVYKQRAFLCRMYPFWVGKKNGKYSLNLDDGCQGIGKGEILSEGFFKDLLAYAIDLVEAV